MNSHERSPDEQLIFEQLLGYLNFSSGATDPSFLANLNRFWQLREEQTELPSWLWVSQRLRQELQRLHRESAAFQDVEQASAVLALAQEQLQPAYRQFHQDSLFHQSDEVLFNAFFLGRVYEAILTQGAPWDDSERIVAGALRQLNDYVGYRPVAVLQSRKTEPYAHERVRPVPLFVRGAGLVCSVYAPVVEQALALLKQTDEDLLRSAFFDPEVLDELAFDPRAYDFDHPVNKRPNYHFGHWDPHQIDNQGRYRRFVVQQVTLDALMQRLTEVEDLPRDELLFEAAAVLAGTILMAAGVSGSGPDSHDSTTTLSNLLPKIAAYRDEFYERLIDSREGEHSARLRQESIDRRQPFGAARQHLNAQLARRRASQLEHAHLAKLFARMGYAEAAAEQACIVPTMSARMLCEIDCRLAATERAIDAHDISQAAALLDEIVARLHRGIECGAIVDPWNILGFDAQFSLFPSLENSVHDHRVDELIELVEQIFVMYARAWSESAARDDTELTEKLSQRFRQLTDWWRQFAAHEVSNVDAIDAADAYHAAEHVTQALNLWHKGGASTGDIRFWAPHAEMFDSPQAYALVINALLEQGDHEASMGLLIHWLSETERVPLEQSESSFHQLAERWMFTIRRIHEDPQADVVQLGQATEVPGESWTRMQKFLDYLEANADEFWQVPQFELGTLRGGGPSPVDEPFDGTDEDEEADGLFSAAYENVVYRDSADDGVEGEVFDSGNPSASQDEDELVHESERLYQRLAFLGTLARLWRTVASSSIRPTSACQQPQPERAAALARWIEQAERNRDGLVGLLRAVQAFRLPTPLADHDSMVEYERRRMVKETLLERIIAACVETANSGWLLEAARALESGELLAADEDDGPEQLTIKAFAAIFRHDLSALREATDDLIVALGDEPLLYVPLAKGGNPEDIVSVRIRQRCLQDLLTCLPRLGLIVESCRLIETARDMERNNPVGPGAVTEYDELFKTGFKSLVHCLVTSAETWGDLQESAGASERFQSFLVARLEELTESLLSCWLTHSKTLRLSVLEKVNDRRAWRRLVSFIERYGAELFTQRFLNIGNVRAILHQGVDDWLDTLVTVGRGELDLRLLDEIDQEISRSEAIGCLTLVLEAIAENYGEYRDYNSTTTQSDRGELLYTLLDFLRLRARYDRVCWNLKPVVMAHEILVRRGHKRAAQTWRRALRERITEEADKFEKRVVQLQKKHAMQMPSIADRVSERFVRPMIIDRICALVQPAVREADRPGPHPTFRILQYEVEFLTREPSGVGFDVPAWLVALEEEVQQARQPLFDREDYDELHAAVPIIRLTHDQIEAQINEWSE